MFIQVICSFGSANFFYFSAYNLKVKLYCICTTLFSIWVLLPDCLFFPWYTVQPGFFSQLQFALPMAVPRGVTYTLSDYRALGPPFPAGYILAFRLFFHQLLDPPFSLVFSFFQSSNVFFQPRGMAACNFNLLHFSFVVLFAVRHTQFFSAFTRFSIIFQSFISDC